MEYERQSPSPSRPNRGGSKVRKPKKREETLVEMRQGREALSLSISVAREVDQKVAKFSKLF